MHGHPLYRLVLVAVVFLGVGLLTFRETHPGAAAAPATEAPAAAAQTGSAATLRVIARAVPVPVDLQVRYLNDTIVSGGGGTGRYAADWQIRLPTEGADLTVAARWPASTPTAATEVTVEFPGGRTVSKTFWFDVSTPDGLRDVLTIPSGGGASPDGAG